MFTSLSEKKKRPKVFGDTVAVKIFSCHEVLSDYSEHTQHSPPSVIHTIQTRHKLTTPKGNK